jgi:3-deoxy-D-manno-octulosonic-acid transferase
MSEPISLRLYALATGLAEPLAPLLLSSRVRRGKEDAARLSERLGRSSRPRPDGPLVWLHGASVGESVSLLPLIARIRTERPDLTVLVTSGTRTSADLLAKRLPAGVIHQYAPVDAPAAVARFLEHWRPGLGLFAESELWPNLILGARRRGVRLALVSARMTEASARGWARRPAAAKAMLRGFETILAQDDASAARLEALGGHVTGRLNLKRLGAPLDVDEAQVTVLKTAFGDRPIILAASTHPGEEALIAAAVRGAPGHPLLIIAPRHPERGEAIASELGAAGFKVARRNQILPPGGEDQEDLDIYLADTLGEMGLLYRLAGVAIMGGSFVPGVGGHNPLEAAQLGVGVITGPDRFNHADPYTEMIAAGAALSVDNARGLERELTALLAAPDRPRQLGEQARAYAAAQAGAFEDGWRVIAPLLPAP